LERLVARCGHVVVMLVAHKKAHRIDRIKFTYQPHAMKKKKKQWGGARAGSGAPLKSGAPLVMRSFKFTRESVALLDRLAVGRSKISVIEEALELMANKVKQG
jgi:hypothetical protein